MRAFTKQFEGENILVALTADNKAVNISAKNGYVTISRGLLFKVSVPLSSWEQLINIGRLTFTELKIKLAQLS